MYSKELCNNINKLTRALGETNLNIFLRAIVHGVWVKEWLTYPKAAFRQSYPSRDIMLAETFKGIRVRSYSYNNYCSRLLLFEDFNKTWALAKSRLN